LERTKKNDKMRLTKNKLKHHIINFAIEMT